MALHLGLGQWTGLDCVVVKAYLCGVYCIFWIIVLLEDPNMTQFLLFNRGSHGLCFCCIILLMARPSEVLPKSSIFCLICLLELGTIPIRVLVAYSELQMLMFSALQTDCWLRGGIY